MNSGRMKSLFFLVLAFSYILAATSATYVYALKIVYAPGMESLRAANGDDDLSDLGAAKLKRRHIPAPHLTLLPLEQQGHALGAPQDPRSLPEFPDEIIRLPLDPMRGSNGLRGPPEAATGSTGRLSGRWADLFLPHKPSAIVFPAEQVRCTRARALPGIAEGVFLLHHASTPSRFIPPLSEGMS